MEKIETALFDFDGVVADTEPIYDQYWNAAAKRYHLNYENFAELIKGSTTQYMLDTYFSGYTPEMKKQVVREAKDFEQQMPLPPMPGVLDFIKTLRAHGIKTGLVTSSERFKINRASALLHLESLFDTFVTADDISIGKPDPECYLLGAKRLDSKPAGCIVFEDSLAGITAGTAAGMRVIGVSGTYPVHTIKDKVYKVITTFEGLTFDDYLSWCK